MASSSRARIAVLAALAATAFPVAAQVYKCENAQGKTTYQQRACDPVRERSTVMVAPKNGAAPPAAARPQPAEQGAPNGFGVATVDKGSGGEKAVPLAPLPPAASPSPEAPTVPPDQQRATVPGAEPDTTGVPPTQPPSIVTPDVMLIAIGHRACGQRNPDFARRTADDYGRWRAAHAKAVDALEQSADYTRLKGEASKTHGKDGAAADKSCSDLERELAEAWGAANPKQRTPEVAWATFMEAVRSGNAPAVQEALSGNFAHDVKKSLPQLLPKFRALQTERLVRVDPGGDQRLGYLRKSGGEERPIVFVKRGSNWRIVEIGG